MAGVKSACCPKCGKQLTLDETGNIGWCSVHQSWYAVTPGYEGVASAKTAEFSRKKEEEKIEDIKKRREIREKLEEEEQSQKRRRVLAVVVIIIAVIALIGVFVLKPMFQYKKACSLYSENQYEEAAVLFGKLGGYKDSEYLRGQAVILSSENITGHMLRDVDGDGEDDLVVLFEGDSLIVYGGCNSSNILLISKEEKARCLSDFALIFEKGNPEKAVECYRKAYTENPTEETKNQLVTIYRKQAEREEAWKNYDKAINYRRLALDATNDKSDFDEYYNIVLRYAQCSEPAKAIEIWDAFIEGESFIIDKFSSENQALEDAGELRLIYAVCLSKTGDSRSLSILHEALDYPVDAISTILECIDNFSICLTRIELRLLLISLYNDDEQIQDQRELLYTDATLALANWHSFGIDATDVISIIKLCKEYDISIGDYSGVFREASLEASGDNIAQYSLVDVDGDGWEELLALYEDGILAFWKLKDVWSEVASFSTGFLNATFILIKSDTYIVLIRDEEENAIAAYSLDNGSLQKLIEEKNIVDYKRNGFKITFGKVLEGSVIRKATYEYDLKSNNTSIVRTGIDWNKNNYDYPVSSSDVVIRWFEALYYDIPEERVLLTATEAYKELGFSFDKSLDIGNVRDIKAVLYASYDKIDLYVVTYTSANNRTEIIYMAVKKDADGRWKNAGLSSSYSAKVEENSITLSSDILALNSKIEVSTIEGEKKTYQIFIPENSRVILNWQSGEKSSSKVAYVVSMYLEDSPKDLIFNYEITPMVETQVSLPFFLHAGVYCFTVKTKSSDSLLYNVLLEAESREYLEEENNDTYDTASLMEIGYTYSGSLSSGNDVDYFIFTIPEAGRVSALISSDSDDKSKIRYVVEIYDNETKTLLTSLSVAGNDMTAETAGLYLKKGSYLLKIARGSYFYGGEYRISLDYGNKKNTELEINDTFDVATVIPVDTEITGVFGYDGDIDCYSFALSSDSIVTPKFSFTPGENNNKAFILSIYNGSQKLYSENVGGKENQKSFSPVVLPKGTYILKIENPRYNGRDYRFVLQTKTVDIAENESNDSIADADELKLNSVVSASLLTEDDIDYFKLEIDKTMNAKLIFSFASKNDKSAAYIVAIEQNGKTAWKGTVKWSQGKLEQEFQFEPGEYYIKVTPSTWDDKIYSLSVITV